MKMGELLLGKNGPDDWRTFFSFAVIKTKLCGGHKFSIITQPVMVTV
jgi:hypothetical protein